MLRVPLNGGQTHAGFGTPKMCPNAKIMWTFFRDQILSPLNARVGRRGLLLYKRLTGKCRWMVRISHDSNHGQKSWDTFAFLRRFPMHTVQPLPLPHKQFWTSVSRIFTEFQLCIRWGGGGGNCKKVSKRMHCFKREPRND